MALLDAGYIVTTSSGAYNKVVQGIRRLKMVMVDDGAGGSDVTITFNIEKVTKIAGGVKDDSTLTKTEAHFGFDTGGEIKSSFNYSDGNGIIVNQVGSNNRLVDFDLDFLLTNGKVGGAGPRRISSKPKRTTGKKYTKRRDK